MAEVHKINDRIVMPDEPVPQLVATLERLLNEALDGTLRGLAFTAVKKDPDTVLVTSHGWHAVGAKHELSSGLFALTHAYSKAIIGG